MFSIFRRPQTKWKTGKVVVFGATTVVGKCLSLLLTLCPQVKELCCFDVLNDVSPHVPGVSVRSIVADLSQIDTGVDLRAVDSPTQWEEAINHAQLVLVCAGNSPNPNRFQRDATLTESASEFILAMELVAKAAPYSIVGLASGPINSLTPLAREVLLRHGVFDPRKLFGITTADVMRTRVLFARELGMNPYDVNVPVVGGRGGPTVCPLLTQTGIRLSHECIVRLCKETQSEEEISMSDKVFATDFSKGNEAAHAGTQQHSALSVANAALEWSVSVMKAQRGDRGITECALVESSVQKNTPFFSTRMELGEEGVARLLPLGPLSPYEEGLVEASVPLLVDDMEAGLRFSKWECGGV